MYFFSAALQSNIVLYRVFFALARWHLGLVVAVPKQQNTVLENQPSQLYSALRIPSALQALSPHGCTRCARHVRQRRAWAKSRKVFAWRAEHCNWVLWLDGCFFGRYALACLSKFLRTCRVSGKCSVLWCYKKCSVLWCFRLTFPMLRDTYSANSMQLGSVRIFDDDGLNILDL